MLRELRTKAIFSFISLLFLASGTFGKSEEEIRVIVDSVLATLNVNEDKAILDAEKLLTTSESSQSHFGLVQSNFILGYLHKKQGNFGKAIIYYLEAIRHADKADYEGSTKDHISVLKNAGIIFKKFKHYDLAKKYYEEAMILAKESGNLKAYTSLVYVTSRLLYEQSEHEEAIILLESTFNNFPNISNRQIADIYNQLGHSYTALKQFKQADEVYKKLMFFIAGKDKLYKKYTAYCYHNLGNNAYEEGNYIGAINYFKLALDHKRENNFSDESLFITYRDLGESYLKRNSHKLSISNLSSAEKLIDNSKSVSKYYEVYKYLSDAHEAIGNGSQSGHYQKLYSASLEGYLKDKEAIEATDKKYNLDLITQRYFALVAEQERNQQIQYYSTAGGSFLVALIVLIIAFFQYRKYRLRKDLEASLKPYIKDAL